MAGGAAVEVGAQSRDGEVGVLAGEFELDVAVELFEAFVAADLGAAGSEQPAERLRWVGSLGHGVPSRRRSGLPV